MSFGFQFDDDELDEEYITSRKVESDASKQIQQQSKSGPSIPKAQSQAKRHSLQELISKLPPLISYSTLTVPLANSSTTTLFRRDLFDARFQLINDDDEENEGDVAKGDSQKPSDWETYSVGAETDLIPGVYEGGFKTWECSLDLIAHLHDRLGKENSISRLKEKRITELGCGTAMPSMYLFSQMVLAGGDSKYGSTFELCDFNEQVLRLVTLPNMILTWYLNTSKDRKGESNGELELTDELLEDFQATLLDLDISLNFYSGSWDALHQVGAFEISGARGNIVLTSETIYSLDSLSSLVDTLELSTKSSLLGKLQKATLTEEEKKPESRQDVCLVAAKVLYFGVGGGANALDEELKLRHATSKAVWKSDQGVARVVLEVLFS